MMRFPTGQAESSVPQVGTFQIEISHLQSQHARILIGITYVTYTYRQRERERERVTYPQHIVLFWIEIRSTF